MSYSLLRGKIAEKYGTVAAFSAALGKTRQTIDRKLHGRAEFSHDDIVQISELLGIKPNEIGKYFFTKKVAK